jgi:hypothetical protein
MPPAQRILHGSTWTQHEGHRPLGGTAVSEAYFWDFRDWLKEKLGEDLELLPIAVACKVG